MSVLSRFLTVTSTVLALALPASATSTPSEDDNTPRVQAVLNGHVLPGFAHLAEATEALKTSAADSCTPQGPAGAALEAAYHDAFDAWVAVGHLRFGPTEVDDRAYGMGFWPDTKGFTKKALNRLISKEDAVVNDTDAFAGTSIAGRGLFALEYLLFDDTMRQAGSPAYRCALVQAIAVDLDRNADAMLADWQGGYAALMLAPGTGEDNPYRDSSETLQALYQTLLSGLQFNADSRLGRPLGSFDRPRPRRAEAWRSARSSRNVAVSLESLATLAALLADGHDEVAGKLTAHFTRLERMLAQLDDPAFAGVAEPMRRFHVEAIQTGVNALRETVTWGLGPALGVVEGFNAMDGD